MTKQRPTVKLSKLITDPNQYIKDIGEEEILKNELRFTGKSTGIMLSLISTAMLNPGCSCLIEDGEDGKYSNLLVKESFRSKLKNLIDKLDLNYFKVVSDHTGSYYLVYNIVAEFKQTTQYMLVDDEE